MSLSDTRSWQWALLTFTLCFLVVEVIVSRMCDSLITLADSFHTLSVSLSLAMPVLLRVVAGRSCPGWLTFGWNRLPALWALTSSLLLSSLCFSITLNALGRFVNAHPPHRPNLSMGIGVIGIAINLVVTVASSSKGSVVWRDLDSEEFFCDILKDSVAQETEDERHGWGDALFSHVQKDPAIDTLCLPLPEAVYDLESGLTPGGMEDGSASPGADGRSPSVVGDGAWSAMGSPSSSEPGAETDLDEEPTEERWEVSGPAPTAADECPDDGFMGSSSFSDGKEEANYLVRHNLCTESPDTTAVSAPTAMESINGNEKSALNSRRNTEEMLAGSRTSTWLFSALGLLRCLFCSCLVLINSLLYHFMDHECLHDRTCPLFFYLDPLFCLMAVLFLLALAIPRVKHASFLLLQGVSGHVSVQKLDEALSGLPGVVGTHELHVWHLSSRHTVASVHMKCADPCTYLDLLHQMQAIFLGQGIRSFTVQPEFVPAHSVPCSLACGSTCSKHLCCAWRKASIEASLPGEGSPLKDRAQELVLTNASI